MSEDDPSMAESVDSSGEEAAESSDATGDVREKLEERADRAAEQLDESVVDLLAWILDTETRARIYVELRQHPDSTSDEIADGTGLYPSTVREALAELHEEGKLERQKRESDGAGNNPYEYRAMAPTELVRSVVGDVQAELNTVFNLDQYLGGETREQEPVKINVEQESTDEKAADDTTTERTEGTATDADASAAEEADEDA